MPNDGFSLVQGRKKKPKSKMSVPAAPPPAASEQKRPRRNAIVGTRQDSKLKAGPRRAEIFVYRVGNEVTADDLKEYMKGERVNVIEIQRVSKEGRAAQSFRMIIESSNPADVLYKPEFWPEGYCCRRWRPSKKNVTTTSSAASFPATSAAALTT